MNPTPQYCWPLLGERCGIDVWVKHENHTPTGAFKVRGGLVFMERLKQANALPVAFQAAVFTSDMDTALHCYRNLDASAVMVNDHTAFRVDWMPFAGLRQSGLGTGGIPYTFHDMQIEKMLVIKSEVL